MLITPGAIGGKGALQDNEPFKGRYKRGVIRDTFWNIICPAPSELQSQGWGDVPPVAPEVIDIFLLQRNRWLPDAPCGTFQFKRNISWWIVSGINNGSSYEQIPAQKYF